MLLNFFEILRRYSVPVSIREYLDLLDALNKRVIFADSDQFYALSRALLVKDERYFDKFDQAFACFMEGVESELPELSDLIPEDWLQREFERYLSEEDKAKISSLGGLDQLFETFQQRLQEQRKRHQGGSRWIGTGGTSPFGAHGYNPEGIRIGQDGGRQGRAVKVWEQRNFRNLDGSVELGTRNIKVALRRLRKFARQDAALELDLDATISGTARQGGMLDIQMVPERHNAVKVLLFIDVGGSMDAHVRLCEELFSACKSELKHLEFFYFHNFIYDTVWQDNTRRHQEQINCWDILHKYSADYKVVFVGDAAMAPYEVNQPGGCIERWNEEAGSTWMLRFFNTYKKLAWLNPTPEKAWGYTMSTRIIQELVQDQMYPLTLKGIEDCMSYLSS